MKPPTKTQIKNKSCYLWDISMQCISAVYLYNIINNIIMYTENIKGPKRLINHYKGDHFALCYLFYYSDDH